MKRLFTIILSSIAFLSFGQKGKSKGPNFDITDFNNKKAVAEWLCLYDNVAWWTSDSAMAQDQKEIERLGKEWFCYQNKNGLWHAIYGKYDKGSFDLVFHFIVDSSEKVKRVYQNVDTTILNSYSRALITANNQLTKLRDTINLSFNQYIKQNEDNTFTVWILPAFQKNNVAIYGGEFIYTIDQTGNRLLKDDSYFQGQFRGFKTDNPREIWLNYRDIDKPSIGGVFFVEYYKAYFTKIYIDTKLSSSTLFHDDEKGYYWVTVEKESEKK